MAERHGVTAATYFADDKGTYAFDHANGTGPFMLESFDRGSKRAVLVRNPNWWGLDQYPHNIDRIEWTVIPDPEARLRALIDGEIDFLRHVPFEGIERIRAAPGLKLAPYADLWVNGLFLNQARGAPPDADVEWSKPLRDRRVREAIYRAIDAQALCDDTLKGLGIPTGSLVLPNMPSYSPELEQRLPYDPAGAKALLTEAGYSAGFDMPLDCADWAETVCRDIARQLAGVGIRVNLSIIPNQAFYSKSKDRALRSTLFSRASADTYGDADLLRYFYSKEGGDIEGYGYANPKFDALIEQIDRADVTYARDALVEEAWRMILQEDIAVVPLYREVLMWAMRDNLDLPTSPADNVYFREARLNPPTARPSDAAAVPAKASDVRD
jgi:peptide/nickel transport system substrate-binding protein